MNMNMMIILVKLRIASTEHQRQNILATVNNDKVYKMICTCNPQLLATDMQRLFLFKVAIVVLFLIGESDGGHRIKRALYIGIKRLWCNLDGDDKHNLTVGVSTNMPG